MSTPPPALLPPPTYVERLWPTFGFWLLAPGAGLFVGIALIPAGPAVAMSAGLAVAFLAAGLLGSSAPGLAVVGGPRPGIRAGRAFLPAEHIGEVRPLDAADTRALLGPRADARAYAVHRGWLREAVQVEVVDERDPAPYWLLSSRHPHALAAAVRARGRRPDDGAGGQAAHSEQTS